jgi:hypothetical protein
MRQNHKLLVATNDHVETLTAMAGNTIRISAVDRNVVTIDSFRPMDREKTIAALSVGKNYSWQGETSEELRFFYDVEIRNNKSLFAIVVSTLLAMTLLSVTYWNSAKENAVLVILGAALASFFCIQA